MIDSEIVVRDALSLLFDMEIRGEKGGKQGLETNSTSSKVPTQQTWSILDIRQGCIVYNSLSTWNQECSQEYTIDRISIQPTCPNALPNNQTWTGPQLNGVVP